VKGSQRFRRLLIALACAALLVVAIAACGGGDDEDGGGQQPAADRPVKLRVGETAGVPFAFLKFGVDKGFYEEVGLDVEPVAVQGAAPILTSVVSGDYEMGGSDTGTFTQGLARDLPLTMITPGTSVSEQRDEDFSALMVAPDSGIERPEDLRGKTVAANILGNITEVSLNGALQEFDVDFRAVEYTEVPFPEMVAAVQRGRVDGAFIIEPFRTIGEDAGLKVLFGPFSTFEAGLQIGSIVTTERYAQENPEVISGFQEAHARTARYIAENEAEFRRALPEISEIAPPLARQVNLPVWQEKVDPESVQRVAEAMAEQGILEETPDVRAAVHEGA
jgi:NitT/TauT family transport system substrate-binding protein